MLKKIQLPLIALLALAGCSTPQPDIRFTRPAVATKPAAPPAPMAADPLASRPLDNALENRVWQLIELSKSANASAIQDGAFLSFQAAGLQVKGSTGCNRLMGRYVMQGQQLKLQDIASTKIFCPGGGIVQEAMFIEALTDTRAWRIDNNHLLLIDGKGNKVAVFELR